MNLREEFNQAIREKNAQTKLEETIQIEDRLLPRRFKMCMRAIKGGEKPGGIGMYRWSLPIQLPPESRGLIEELIDLCPSHCWKTPPDKIGEVGWIPGTNTYTCYLHSSPLQYRLSDGSVHVGWFDTKIEKERIWIKPKFRLTQKGKDAAFRDDMALAERQTREAISQEDCQILEERLLHNPMITGARESITIGYTSDITNKHSTISYDRFRNSIFIFRDGTVYEPHPYRVDYGIAVRKLGSPGAMEFLQQECSRLVKQWASNS